MVKFSLNSILKDMKKDTEKKKEKDEILTRVANENKLEAEKEELKIEHNELSFRPPPEIKSKLTADEKQDRYNALLKTKVASLAGKHLKEALMKSGKIIKNAKGNPMLSFTVLGLEYATTGKLLLKLFQHYKDTNWSEFGENEDITLAIHQGRNYPYYTFEKVRI